MRSAAFPQERSRYHICWGSWNGPHAFDVPLKDIVDLLLQVKVGHYSVEQANPRHEHEWTVWQSAKLPPGKKLIPGVISHATNIVEHPELVAQRLVRLAKIVGRENVMGGTDCGFAQSPFAQRVHPSIMWAKLRSLSEGAKLATARVVGQARRNDRQQKKIGAERTVKPNGRITCGDFSHLAARSSRGQRRQRSRPRNPTFRRGRSRSSSRSRPAAARTW